MKRIYLIGFMGTGKTTVGEALGKLWSIPVYDTDKELEKIEGRSISTIFSTDGEAYFRSRETEMLKAITDSECIITTGGGMVLKEENQTYMKTNGKVVLLKASIEEILNRIGNDHTRPLLEGDKKEKVSNLYLERLSLYEQAAHIVINTDGKTIQTIINEIDKKVGD